MTEIMNREENVQDLKYSGSLKSDNKEEITWNKEDEVYDFCFIKILREYLLPGREPKAIM